MPKELAAVCEPTSLADFARAGTDGAPLAGTADWQAVTIDAPLLKDGHIAGIEFYPGFFGKENEWGGWRHRDNCSPARVSECIENTRIMRESTVKILNAAMGW